eukprot:m51a1_g5298 putative protein serine threonine (4111) ;mRNA; f:230586-243269
MAHSCRWAALAALAALCSLAAASEQFSSDLWVAASGSDSGACAAPETPCATIPYALAQATAGATNTTVHVALGTLRLPASVAVAVAENATISVVGQGSHATSLSNALYQSTPSTFFAVSGGSGGARFVLRGVTLRDTSTAYFTAVSSTNVAVALDDVAQLVPGVSQYYASHKLVKVVASVVLRNELSFSSVRAVRPSACASSATCSSEAYIFDLTNNYAPTTPADVMRVTISGSWFYAIAGMGSVVSCMGCRLAISDTVFEALSAPAIYSYGTDPYSVAYKGPASFLSLRNVTMASFPSTSALTCTNTETTIAGCVFAGLHYDGTYRGPMLTFTGGAQATSADAYRLLRVNITSTTFDRISVGGPCVKATSADLVLDGVAFSRVTVSPQSGYAGGGAVWASVSRVAVRRTSFVDCVVRLVAASGLQGSVGAALFFQSSTTLALAPSFATLTLANVTVVRGFAERGIVVACSGANVSGLRSVAVSNVGSASLLVEASDCLCDGGPCAGAVPCGTSCAPEVADYYASPTGAGSACGPATPCALATALSAATTAAVPDKRVHLAAGTYRLPQMPALTFFGALYVGATAGGRAVLDNSDRSARILDLTGTRANARVRLEYIDVYDPLSSSVYALSGSQVALTDTAFDLVAVGQRPSALVAHPQFLRWQTSALDLRGTTSSVSDVSILGTQSTGQLFSFIAGSGPPALQVPVVALTNVTIAGISLASSSSVVYAAYCELRVRNMAATGSSLGSSGALIYVTGSYARDAAGNASYGRLVASNITAAGLTAGSVFSAYGADVDVRGAVVTEFAGGAVFSLQGFSSGYPAGPSDMALALVDGLYVSVRQDPAAANPVGCVYSQGATNLVLTNALLVGCRSDNAYNGGALSVTNGRAYVANTTFVNAGTRLALSYAGGSAYGGAIWFATDRSSAQAAGALYTLAIGPGVAIRGSYAQQGSAVACQAASIAGLGSLAVENVGDASLLLYQPRQCLCDGANCSGALLRCSGCTSPPLSLYVSPVGADNAACSLARPCASLSWALNVSAATSVWEKRVFLLPGLHEPLLVHRHLFYGRLSVVGAGQNATVLSNRRHAGGAYQFEFHVLSSAAGTGHVFALSDLTYLDYAATNTLVESESVAVEIRRVTHTTANATNFARLRNALVTIDASGSPSKQFGPSVVSAVAVVRPYGSSSSARVVYVRGATTSAAANLTRLDIVDTTFVGVRMTNNYNPAADPAIECRGCDLAVARCSFADVALPRAASYYYPGTTIPLIYVDGLRGRDGALDRAYASLALSASTFDRVAAQHVVQAVRADLSIDSTAVRNATVYWAVSATGEAPGGDATRLVRVSIASTTFSTVRSLYGPVYTNYARAALSGVSVADCTTSPLQGDTSTLWAGALALRNTAATVAALSVARCSARALSVAADAAGAYAANFTDALSVLSLNAAPQVYCTNAALGGLYRVAVYKANASAPYAEPAAAPCSCGAAPCASAVCAAASATQQIYWGGASGNATCGFCPAGTGLDAATLACWGCAPGTRSTSAGCLACPAGQRSDANASACAACPAGTYATNNTCAACPAGSVALYGGLARCTRCQRGSYEAGRTACLQCAPGSVSAEGSTSCASCSAGHVSDATNSYCYPCPPGTRANLSACAPCGPGTVAPSRASTQCARCPDGRYASVGVECLPCAAAGYYSAGGLPCAPCPAGTREVGHSSCAACDAGSVSGPGATACLQCPAGTRAVEGSACEPCAPGQVSAAGAAQCRECDAGTYETLRTQCIACPQSTVSARGSGECSLCPPGTVEVNRTQCVGPALTRRLARRSDFAVVARPAAVASVPSASALPLLVGSLATLCAALLGLGSLRRVHLLVVMVACIAVAQPTIASVYYVAQSGSDTSNCTAAATPCATIAYAVGKAAADTNATLQLSGTLRPAAKITATVHGLLRLVGSGVGATVINGTSVNADLFAVTGDSSGGSVFSLEGLTVYDACTSSDCSVVRATNAAVRVRSVEHVVSRATHYKNSLLDLTTSMPLLDSVFDSVSVVRWQAMYSPCSIKVACTASLIDPADVPRLIVNNSLFSGILSTSPSSPYSVIVITRFFLSVTDTRFLNISIGTSISTSIITSTAGQSRSVLPDSAFAVVYLLRTRFVGIAANYVLLATQTDLRLDDCDIRSASVSAAISATGDAPVTETDAYSLAKVVLSNTRLDSVAATGIAYGSQPYAGGCLFGRNVDVSLNASSFTDCVASWMGGASLRLVGSRAEVRATQFVRSRVVADITSAYETLQGGVVWFSSGLTPDTAVALYALTFVSATVVSPFAPTASVVACSSATVSGLRNVVLSDAGDASALLSDASTCVCDGGSCAAAAFDCSPPGACAPSPVLLYASPSGLASASCGPGSPCDFTTAVERAAGIAAPERRVVVLPGMHSVRRSKSLYYTGALRVVGTPGSSFLNNSGITGGYGVYALTLAGSNSVFGLSGVGLVDCIDPSAWLSLSNVAFDIQNVTHVFASPARPTLTLVTSRATMPIADSVVRNLTASFDWARRNVYSYTLAAVQFVAPSSTVVAPGAVPRVLVSDSLFEGVESYGGSLLSCLNCALVVSRCRFVSPGGYTSQFNALAYAAASIARDTSSDAAYASVTLRDVAVEGCRQCGTLAEGYAADVAVERLNVSSGTLVNAAVSSNEVTYSPDASADGHPERLPLVVVRDSTIAPATTTRGCVLARSSRLVVERTSLANCRAARGSALSGYGDRSGGGVAATNSVARVSDTSFDNCSADVGLVDTADTASVTVGGALFYETDYAATYAMFVLALRNVSVRRPRGSRGSALGCRGGRVAGLAELRAYDAGDAELLYAELSPCLCDGANCSAAAVACAGCTSGAQSWWVSPAGATGTGCTQQRPCASVAEAFAESIKRPWARKVVRLSAGSHNMSGEAYWLYGDLVIAGEGAGATTISGDLASPYRSAPVLTVNGYGPAARLVVEDVTIAEYGVNSATFVLASSAAVEVRRAVRRTLARDKYLVQSTARGPLGPTVLENFTEVRATGQRLGSRLLLFADTRAGAYAAVPEVVVRGVVVAGFLGTDPLLDVANARLSVVDSHFRNVSTVLVRYTTPAPAVRVVSTLQRSADAPAAFAGLVVDPSSFVDVAAGNLFETYLADVDISDATFANLRVSSVLYARSPAPASPTLAGGMSAVSVRRSTFTDVATTRGALVLEYCSALLDGVVAARCTCNASGSGCGGLLSALNSNVALRNVLAQDGASATGGGALYALSDVPRAYALSFDDYATLLSHNAAPVGSQLYAAGVAIAHLSRAVLVSAGDPAAAFGQSASNPPYCGAQSCQSAACAAALSSPMYVNSSTDLCAPCAMGAAPTAARDSCAPCASGTQAVPAGCAPCAAGQVNYNGTIGCVACPAGMAAVGATDCAACPAGSVVANGSSCAACAPGTYETDRTACLPCAPGTASAAGTSGACSPCASGLVANADHTACVGCGPGTYESNNVDCAPCATGYVSAANASLCDICPPGTYAVAGTSCAPCTAPGTYSSGGSGACAPCAAGTYEVAHTSCAVCSAGSVSAQGSTACAQCDAGTYEAGRVSCVACPANTVSAKGTSSTTGCSACPAGSWPRNASECVDCAVTWSPLCSTPPSSPSSSSESLVPPPPPPPLRSSSSSSSSSYSSSSQSAPPPPPPPPPPASSSSSSSSSSVGDVSAARAHGGDGGLSGGIVALIVVVVVAVAVAVVVAVAVILMKAGIVTCTGVTGTTTDFTAVQAGAPGVGVPLGVVCFAGFSRLKDRMFDDTGATAPLPPVSRDPLSARVPLLEALRAVSPLVQDLETQLQKTAEAWETSSKARALGLARDDALAVLLYTAEIRPHEESIFYRLNRALRERRSADDATWTPFAVDLVLALRGIPAFRGVVYRGIDVGVDPEAYAVGRTVCWNGFTSTSSDRIDQENGTLFEIETTRGRDIESLNMFNESEVLLEASSEFKVVDVLPARSPRDPVVIRMSEVDPPSSPLIPLPAAPAPAVATAETAEKPAQNAPRPAAEPGPVPPRQVHAAPKRHRSAGHRKHTSREPLAGQAEKYKTSRHEHKDGEAQQGAAQGGADRAEQYKSVRHQKREMRDQTSSSSGGSSDSF